MIFFPKMIISYDIKWAIIEFKVFINVIRLSIYVILNEVKDLINAAL